MQIFEFSILATQMRGLYAYLALISLALPFEEFSAKLLETMTELSFTGRSRLINAVL